jgi:hypothetical protein
VSNLHLAVDNNVATLPIHNLMDLGDTARELGRRLDAGEYGNVLSVIALIATEDGLNTFTFGHARNGYELMGIFEAAKLQCFASDASEIDDG